MKHIGLWVVVLALVAGTCVAAEGEAEAGWDATVALGATLTDGNSDTLTANGSFTAARDWEKHQLRTGVDVNYGETTTETVAADGTVTEDTDATTQNAKAYANYKRTFGRFFLYSDDSIFHDDLGGVDYRLVVGAGLGAFLVETDRTKLGAELGLAYITEEQVDGTSEDGISLRLAARLEHAFSDSAKCWAAVEYLPTLEDFGDALLNGEAGAEAALNASLSLRVVVQDRYDSTPPAGNTENDVAVIGSLVYKL